MGSNPTRGSSFRRGRMTAFGLGILCCVKLLFMLILLLQAVYNLHNNNAHSYMYITFVQTHIHSYSHTLMHSYTHTSIHSYTHIHTLILIHSYTHTSIHSYIHTLILIHSYTHTSIHPYIHTLILIHSYTRSYTHTHTFIHTYIHSYTRTFIHSYSYIHTHVHTLILIHSYTHTSTHTHVHSYTHTFIHYAAGMDYNATIQPAEIQTTQTQLPIEIPIVDDSILEIDESFTVILTVAGDDSNVILGPQNTARVTITDNDSEL